MPSKKPRVDTPLTPKSPSALSQHRPLIYICSWEDCRRAFSRPCRLEEHVRSHTGERPFICAEPGCSKTFVRDYHLSRHKKISHADERPHNCSYESCDLSFATAQRLRLHEQTHEKKNTYRCRDYSPCDLSFRKKSTLQAHINSAHLGLDPYICTERDEETEELCRRGFQNSSGLNQHILNAHGPPKYICSVCTLMSLESAPQPDIAMTGASGPASPVSLLSYNSTSAAAFRTNRELQKHIGEEHPDQAPLKLKIQMVQVYECEICGKEFSKKSNLDNHILVVHEKAKRFICGETDVSKSKHLFGPKGEHPWDGNGCGEAFGYKSVLEDHIRIDHLGLPAKQTVRLREKRRDDEGKGRRKQKSKSVPAVSKLLGREFGDDVHDALCLVLSCSTRFLREHDLKKHCMTSHHMGEQDVEEALMERQALAGGQFWLGGIDPEEERAEMSSDEEEDDDDAYNADAGKGNVVVPVDPELDEMDEFVEAVKRM